LAINSCIRVSVSFKFIGISSVWPAAVLTSFDGDIKQQLSASDDQVILGLILAILNGDVDPQTANCAAATPTLCTFKESIPQGLKPGFVLTLGARAKALAYLEAKTTIGVETA
jgi:hypothetical protein